MTKYTDIRLQAEWEIFIEEYEAAVAKEKERILNERKSWFPWRIKLININKGKKNDWCH